MRQAAIREALAGLAFAASLSMAACSAYDASRLPEPPRPRAGTGGSGGAGGMSGASGSGVVGCGDGVVAATEKCDTKIAAGAIGACPVTCPAVIMGTACVPRQLQGTACQAECSEVAATCMDGDGCCSGPPCTSQNDDDCSASCGNGVVEADMGETCEPGSADGGVDAGVTCPTVADCDDDEACTVDSVLGSAMTCNAQCLHTEIAAAVDDDGCCPSGANSIADNDCPIVCGNGVVEGDEECDGSEGCDGDCKATFTQAQRDCFDLYTTPDSPSEECQRCACLQCTDQVNACRGDSDAARRMKCEALIDCALAQNCTGNACFCGTDASCWFPDGPCLAETAAAANEVFPDPNLVNVNERCNGASANDFACGRAIALGTCASMNCASCPK